MEPAPEEPQNYWFGPKSIGIGIGPKSWQGWLLTLGLVAFLLAAVWISPLLFSRAIAIAFDLFALIAGVAVYLWIVGKHTSPDAEF